MAQQDDNIKKLYDELQSTYDVGSEDDFRNYLNNAEHRKALYNELKNDYDIQDEKAFDDYLGYINGEKAPGTTKVGSVAQQVVNEYDQSAKDNAEAEEDLSAATAGAKIGGNISLTPAKPNNQQTAQPAVDNTAKSVMDANGTPVEQPKATGPKTQFVSEDPNYVSGTPKEEALKKYPWMQPDQVYLWNKTTKEPVVSYVDESGQAVTDEDLQIKKAKSEITGQEDTEYMHPEAAALQLPNGNTRGVRLKKGALTQMADEIMRKEYGDNYLNTQFGKDGNVYTGAERRDLGAQQLYDELNSDVRKARISFAVADDKDRNEILSRIKAKWGKVADETSLVNAVNDENAAKQDIDIVAQQNINDLNAEIQNISRQMDQRGAEIDNASSPFVDQTFNARDVDAKYRLLQSKLNYAQNALKSWENVKNSGSLDALAGFKDAVMDISAWDFGFSDLKNSIALLTAKGNDKQELVNLYGRYAEAAKFEDKYNPDSYRYGKIAGTSMPYALQFAGTGGGFKSIGSAVSKKATSIAEKYALEGLKKQVVKGLGVVAGDIARAYTMSGTIQGLNTISDILNRSAGELTVDKQGNYQLKSDEPLLKSIYKGVTASAIENYTEMLGERLNIGGNLMRMLPKIGLGRVSNAITKIGTQDWYRVCNNWLSRAGVNDFGGEVLEEEIGIILNAALVGDNPLLNGSGGLLDVRTQKDILGGMLYSISAMRAGALAMYGVKKGVGSAFIKTLDMYDKMQLNQSDKGGQSIFGEGWAAIKDEIDNTPNEKVNAVIEKLAKEHPSKDEQSAIIDYAVKLLKTRGHNLGIAMASDGENDEGAQEEVQDMPDLSQPNAEYFNKDDGMIHKASLYPDASDPTGTAKDVFIIKGNLVTNEDGSINKDASDDTIIYIDGNGERHIASPDKFAAAYPPMPNDEVRQANEGVAGEGTQTTDTFNKGDEVNINVNGIIYTATIQGTDGSGNYNVYYEDENGMMRPAQFTADQLAAMNSASTASNDKQNMIEQLAGNQQQIEQPAQEQVAQQEQPAQEEQKPAIPTDEKGNMLYHQVPVETTINDLYDGSLDDNEIRDFVDANISEADKNLEKVNKKAPKIGTNKDEYLKKKQEWQKQVEDATRIRDYWNSVKDYIAQQTHTTPEEIQAAQDELSGEAAKREYQGMAENIQQDPISVASDFIRGAKITPESFKAETGYGTDEQRKFVGMIAKAEKGGKTIDRLAEELVSYDNAEMNGVQFGGDTSSAKDAILSALQGAGTRGELKQTNEAEEQAYVDARNAARDAQYMEQYGMTYEEYLAYEEQIMPTIWREYNNYDETAFNNMYAEEIEQLLKSKENDTTGEKQADDRGNQVLSEQQVTEQRGSTGSQEQRTEAPVGVQGTVEDGVVPERTSEDRQEDGSVPDRTEEVESATEGLTSEDADNLLSAMEARAEVAPDIELTPTNWVEQFGEDGMVDTPIGKVKMGENQIAKLFTKGRSSQFGMIRPTLTNPDVIVEVPSSTDSANDVERPTSLLFIKAFLKNDGSKVYYFKSVTVKKDGLEVSVSSHLDRKKRVEDALRKGKLQYRFDGGAQTEHRPANVSVTTPLAGQGASNKGNATIGDQSVSDMENGTLASPQLVSSESKDSDKSAFAQTIDEKIAKAEEETDVNPTEGQKEAGNYKKGHVRIDGYDITIEQPKGSVRRGTDADGKQWEQTMNNTYGYIRGTEGVDGDHIDIFLSDNPTEGNVYVVDQVNPDGSFDEHKVMYGFNSADEARNAYLSNYEEGWQGLGTITEISKDEFKKWVNSSHRKTKPFAEYKSVKEDNNNIRFRETNNEVSVFALKHNLNEKDVEDYADYIRRGNLNGASRAFKEIRRKVRLDNQGASLGQFAKIFSPIEKELYERFGNIDELRQQYVQRTLDERNAMEAARKKAEEEAEAERRRLQEFQNMSSEQLDAEYMKAVEANDESRMRDLVNEAARRNGYGDTGSEYQGVGAWSAPSNPGYESDEERRAAVENDAPDVNITDIANGYSQQPSDYFTNLRAYGTDTAHGRESAEAINKAIDEVRNGKDPMVKVYRAVPKSVKEGKLRNGDWVTPSRKYAEMHGDNRLEGDYRIIEQEVPASQLWWDGNDINEWGFDDGKGYAYRNTKNNRKLNDLITRDDKGNIIPLSQRFNARKADVRYRNTENQAATDNIEDVNKQFNQQLEGLTEENADKVTLSLGRPSAVLRAAGVEDKPMKLYGNKVIKKMRKHGFTLAEIKDLPRAVADPIAVFNNYQKNGNRSILTELQIGDKHILVSVTVGKTGVDADFNIVSSVFGKGSNNVVDWINKGYATFINKEKALDYLHFSERSISEASDNQELVSTANIIRNFENPNVLEENLVPTEQTNDIDTAVADTANKLNIGVRVAHSIDEVNNDSARRAIEQGRRIQGFYDTRTGEIVVYAPNAVDAEDAVRTVLHEAVAHYGLRKLFGSNFDTFLYNVYNNADMDVREKISQLAAQHNWNFATATEEYLASLAEKTNFENLNASWWDKIKSLFLKLLHNIGLKGFTGVSLSDNELRYILWRSYENLKNPGRYRSIIDEAKDITMQNELRVGNYSAGNSEAVGKAAENGVVNIEDVNRRFNEELGRLTEENAQSVILNLGRPGNFLLASGLSDRPIKLYGNKLLKKMRKHGFTTSDVKNLPKEINNPIAVFKGSVENSFAILTELEINGNNVLASISVGKGNDIDFNIISSVYGKNGNSVVSWINDGKILYVNKEKALNYLRISAPSAEAQDNQELSSAANIVKNFENPNISEENMRYGNGALAASESNGINKTNETNGQEAEEANRRFNEELNAFKAKTHKGLLHLGQPGRILNACGINEELTLSPTVLSRKLKQHGLNVDDIKGLAGAIQEPILVYQHGDAHPNMVIVTDLAAKGGKVSVAVELDGEGNVVELNNVSSVHSKDATTELERLSNMRDGYLEQALRWVDKNEVSDWLGIADLNSPIHANNPKLVSIANILQNFENPSVGEENILYREAKKVEKKINSDWRDEYDKKLSTLWFKLTEAAQDAMRSVKILQDIIAKETSAPISDDENVYWRENRLSSVNKYEQEYYAENYFKPIVTEIANLVKYGARYNDKGKDIINSDNDILKYLIAKHGIERNNYFREREAMNARKPYEDQIKELQKQVEKEEIKEEDANKKIAKLQEQADKAEMKKRVDVLHKDYSGLTELFQDKKDFDTLATSYVSDFEKKFDTKSLWNAINRATKETLRKAFVDGLISRESYENTAKMYKYYIPLRGWANDVASEKYNYIGGKGHSSKILEISHGRTSLADNPISKIGQMMQDAILQGNRNRMKQAVYNLAMNHDTSLLNIKRQWYQNMGTKDNPIWERVFPDLNSEMTAEQVAEEVEDFESRMRELKKEGKATQNRKGLILRLHTTKREETQHRISVAINGKEYNIFVNGNPRAAQAINGELNDVDRYGSYISKINRFLSQVYTSVNPEFVVTNYQRDAGFAASIVASTEPLSYQKEWAKNMTKYNPITTGEYLRRLIKKAKTGNINPNNKAERYMQEFLSNGGETGFTNILNIDDYKKLIRREIKSINSVVSMPKAARAAVAFTERVNTVFEDATRYATYVTSREQGRTIDRSIRDAKEISLNFNTRGADGLPGDSFIYRFFRGLRRWMIFVNPSIQGLNKAGMAFRNHPLRSSMMIAGLPTLLGYALPAIMQAVVGGGDGDDDDKNVVESYKDLPKWVRRTNIAIPIGGNNFVTIPLSYELRVSYGLGEMMWEYGEGMIDGKEMAAETLLQLSDLLPVSLFNGTLVQSISPTIARPFVDIIQNRNFYGKKIYNDSQFIEGYPEYMKAYAGTPKWLVKSTEVLNNVMPKFGADVSDKYTPGLIDLNPAMIDYLLSSYLGGLYNFPSKFGKTISMIWDEDMRDIQNVPILSRNWKNSQSGNPYNSGDRYKTYMKEYDLSKQRFNGYKKEAKNDVPEFLNSLKDLLNTPSGKRMLMIDAYKRGGLDKLNQRIRDIDAYDNERYEGEKDALTKKRDGLKEELINKLDSISDGTLDFVNGEWTRK